MLPFVAALGLFLTWRTWHTRGDAAAVRASASRLAVFCLVTVAIAGWWYANNLIVYGDIVGSNDAIALARQGGLLKGLSGKLSLSLGIRSMVSIVVSFLWAGTWSLVYPPPVTEIPIMILLIVAAVGWIWHVARVKAMSSLDAIAALTLVLFIIALLQHTLVLISLLRAFSPAWYLHSLPHYWHRWSRAGSQKRPRGGARDHSSAPSSSIRCCSCRSRPRCYFSILPVASTSHPTSHILV